VVQIEQGRIEIVAVALRAGRVVDGEVPGYFRALEVIVRADVGKKKPCCA